MKRVHLNIFHLSLLSMLLWLIPFCIRICMGQMSITNQSADTFSPTINNIFQAYSSGDTFQAFLLIFENNILCCILNILNGFLLGVGTILNLLLNGFMSADTFASCYYQGMFISDILKTTLPHSFEMLGVWLSGGIGFMIAWRIKRFAFNDELIGNYSAVIGIQDTSLHQASNKA